MIVYSATKKDFLHAVRADTLADQVDADVQKFLGRKTPESEYRSWRNSAKFMRDALDTNDIPDDCVIAIEYQPPGTSKRIDYLVTGLSSDGSESCVIVELKQWDKAEATNLDAIVRTYVGNGLRNVSHPSYQAWSYAELIRGFNERVYSEDVGLHPCAFLHNYPTDDDTLHAIHYLEHTEKAPIFRRGEAIQLGDFIASYVRKSDHGKLLYEIDKGRVRPSKKLADSLVSLMQGNKEFILIDEQKVIFEEIIQSVRDIEEHQKKVFIIKGGPGTGKSVVSINLLVSMIAERFNVQYVSRNAAPREVYAAKLQGSMRKTHINNLFKGSGSYVDCEKNTFHALIVDEAHRLNEKSGMFKHQGENQIKEIITAAQLSIFFIDPAQKVTVFDIGDISEIEHWAAKAGAEVTHAELPSQFRCGGSDGYLSFIDNALNIRETAVTSLDGINYDFRVFYNPEVMRKEIVRLNATGQPSRMLTGYCWPWISKKDPDQFDVVLQEHNFAMRWNDFNLGQSWIMHEESVEQIGVIHTSQGLEVDYVGVIIGPDLRMVDGELIADPYQHPGQDKALQGYKKLIKEDPVGGAARISEIIRNTYRVLLSRGAKGCFVYCVDPELQHFFMELDGEKYTVESELKVAEESSPYMTE